MGACCARPASPTHPRESSYSDPQVNSTRPSEKAGYSTEPERLKKEEKIEKEERQKGLPPEKKIGMEGKSTLRDQLINSPGWNPRFKTEFDLENVKELPKTVCFSPELSSEFFTPKITFPSPCDKLSLEILWNIEGNEEKKEFPVSPLSRARARARITSGNLLSPELGAEFFTPIIGFPSPCEKSPLEKLRNMEGKEEKKEFPVPLLTRNPSGKTKKTVTFMPKEDDVIIFFSPEQTFED